MKKKALMMWIDEEIHQIIKMRSAYMNQTMTNYVVEAIADRMEKERQRGWPDYLKDKNDN